MGPLKRVATDKVLSLSTKKDHQNSAVLILFNPHFTRGKATRSEPTNLKEMAPMKRIAIQNANNLLKCGKKSTKVFEGHLKNLGQSLMEEPDNDDKSFICSMCLLFPEVCGTGPKVAAESKTHVTSHISQNEDKFAKVSKNKHIVHTFDIQDVNVITLCVPM